MTVKKKMWLAVISVVALAVSSFGMGIAVTKDVHEALWMVVFVLSLALFVVVIVIGIHFND